MSRPWKFCLAGAVVALLGVALGFYWSLHYVPSFYRQALQADPQQQTQASEEMVAQAMQLSNRLRYDPRWQAEFTQQQINGWLAVDLPENHPDLLPPEVKDPRVWITPQGVYLACRYQTKALDTVVHVLVDAYVTEDHQLALHLRHVKAGAVPLPMNEVVETIGQQASRWNLSLRWAQKDGTPVALVQLPPLKNNRRVVVDSIRLEEGKILLQGRTLGVQSAAGPEVHRVHRQ